MPGSMLNKMGRGMCVMCKYAYCPVNVSRAVGPRCVDRAINNLSNDLEI